MSSSFWGGAGGENNGGGGGGGGIINNNIIGPCGACKFLRRKCISGCVFAPYFQLEQGAAYFAAVHKVFGARNASKMLLSIPPHKRLDAVVSMCYEALARVRDPVYGCVAQIFTLQQQVLNLQAELAYTQARLATVHHQHPQQPDQTSSLAAEFQSVVMCGMMMQPDQQSWSADVASVFVDQGEVDDGEDDDEELQSLARELVSKHSFAFQPSTTSP